MIPIRPIVEAVEFALAAAVLAALVFAILLPCRLRPVQGGIALLLAVLGSFVLVALDAAAHGAMP